MIIIILQPFRVNVSGQAVKHFALTRAICVTTIHRIHCSPSSRSRKMFDCLLQNVDVFDWEKGSTNHALKYCKKTRNNLHCSYLTPVLIDTNAGRWTCKKWLIRYFLMVTKNGQDYVAWIWHVWKTRPSSSVGIAAAVLCWRHCRWKHLQLTQGDAAASFFRYTDAIVEDLFMWISRRTSAPE